ncbi:MAG: hypothetical protein ACI83O_000077 [Patescibacteria group bacterium]|jgi:hypothetical protein
MRFKNKVIVASIVGASAIVTTLVYAIIPCKKIANVPNPVSGYQMCTLNPSEIDVLTATIKYFGYTDLVTAYMIVFGIPFILFLLLMHFMRSKKKV